MTKVKIDKRLRRAGLVLIMGLLLALLLVACSTTGTDNGNSQGAAPTVAGENAVPTKQPTATATPMPTATSTPTILAVLIATPTPVPYYFGSGTEPPDLQGINNDLLTEAAKYATPKNGGSGGTGGGSTPAPVNTTAPAAQPTTSSGGSTTTKAGGPTPIPVRTIAVPPSK